MSEDLLSAAALATEPADASSDRIGRPWASEAMGRSPVLWTAAAILGLLAAVTVPLRQDVLHDLGAPMALAWGLTFAALPLVGIVDARIRIIPNRILLPLTIADTVLAVVAVATGGCDLSDLMLGLACGTGLGLYAFTILFIAPVGGYGWGDVKLTALLGFVLGMKSAWLAVAALAIAPPLLAIVPTLVALAVTKNAAMKIAFGPYIIAAAVLVSLVLIGYNPLAS